MNISALRTWLAVNRKTVLMYLPLAVILGGGIIGMATNSWRYDPEQTDKRMAEIETELNDRYIEDIRYRNDDNLSLGRTRTRGGSDDIVLTVNGQDTDCVLHSDEVGFYLSCAPGTVHEDPVFAQTAGQSLYGIVAASR